MVVHVVDGDTLAVNQEGFSVEVGLYGVDALEMDQNIRDAAQALASFLTLNEQVLVKPVSHDRYRRTVAKVVLPDGRDLSRELVRTGLSWLHRKYAPNDEVLAALEPEAKAAARGLWGDSGAVEGEMRKYLLAKCFYIPLIQG